MLGWRNWGHKYVGVGYKTGPQSYALLSRLPIVLI